MPGKGLVPGAGESNLGLVLLLCRVALCSSSGEDCSKTSALQGVVYLWKGSRL